MLDFSCDYNAGAHEIVLDKLIATNYEKTAPYGTDLYCKSAEEKIRAAASAPDAKVLFLSGGTQTNMVALSAILRSYQGVISAVSGHIATHEAGAIENTGHKVITIPEHAGKIDADELRAYFVGYYADEAREHAVMPGAVYISQPTEYGTIYSRSELLQISKICREYGAYLYLDGARLGYALASPQNDTTLSDIAALTDIFYIGGTKVGALFGEALVITRPEIFPSATPTVKQLGALLAKGRLVGAQFDVLFDKNNYVDIASDANRLALKLRESFEAIGIRMFIDSYTNQQFPILDNRVIARLRDKVVFKLWEKYDESHSVTRFVTSFVTTEREVDELIVLVKDAMLELSHEK